MKWQYDICVTLKDKQIFSQMCESYSLPTPVTYGLTIDGKLVSNKRESLNDILYSEYDVMFIWKL